MGENMSVEREKKDKDIGMNLKRLNMLDWSLDSEEDAEE